MTVEILKNGGEHECNAVDEIIAKLDVLQKQGGRGRLLLIDLHRLSVTNHPRAGIVSDAHKADLKNARLLEDDGTPSQLVKDVVLSATYGDGDTLKYTGTPYINDRPHHECPARAILNHIFPFLKRPHHKHEERR